MRTLGLMIAVMCAGTLAAQATVTSIFQDPAIGEVKQLDDQGRLEVAVSGAEVPQRVPLDEVEQVAFGHLADQRNPDEAPLRVYLINGDVVYGAPDDGPEDDEEYFILRSRRLGELLLNIEHVARIEYVRNVPPDTLPAPESGQRYDIAYFAARGDNPPDVDSGATLTRVTRRGAYIYNELFDGDNLEGTLSPWANLQGIVRAPQTHRAAEELIGLFTLRDGSMLHGIIRAWGEGSVRIRHRVLDREFTLEESNILSVTMMNGRYIYLSDMEFGAPPEERPYYLPDDFDYETYMFRVRRDRAQGGGPIRIGGRVYPKGLGVHSISRLHFDLNRGYTRFMADIGLDDSAGELGSVEFKVYADGELVYESGVVRRTSGVRSIDIDVLNVRRLTLVVTAADNADIQDRANWANAKVVR
jgi:hypothetical protein